MRIENSFLPARGVGEKTERTLWRNGVTHWDAFEDDGTLGPKTTDNVLSFIEAARTSLDAGETRFFADCCPNGALWRLYGNVERETCFFDIETTGLSRSSDVTTVSFHRDGETRTLVRGRDLTRGAIETELDASSLLVSFNGKCFDQPFLEREFDLEIETPHVDLQYLCGRLGLSGGLDAVERELGIDRGGVDLDGRDAVRLWYEYRDGDESALERLVRYNRLDTRNLQPLLDHACEALTQEIFAPYAP